MDNMANGTRTLLVNYILMKKTDEDHFLSRDDLIEILERIGGHASNNTIKADLDAITSFNQIIEKQSAELLGEEDVFPGAIHLKTIKKKGTAVKDNLFSVGELIILYKFIENSFYLSEKEKKSLMDKILVNTSSLIIEKYHLNQPFLSQAYDFDNQNIQSLVDTIQKAMTLDRCLKFHYYTYQVSGHHYAKKELPKDYEIYPIRFMMDAGYLYVMGYDVSQLRSAAFKQDTSKQLNVRSYRVDRMGELMTKTKSRTLTDYLSQDIIQEAIASTNHNINGFYSEETMDLSIKIFTHGNIEKSPFKAFVDRFGNQITSIEEHQQYLILNIKDVNKGIGMMHYLFGFHDQVEVLEPKEYREEIKKTLEAMQSIYQ